MDQNQNPVYTKGNRNVFCPYYRDCLDHSARHHWEYWTCFACHHKLKKKSCEHVLFAEGESTPYYHSSSEISGIFDYR
jgi:hypothetical protein